MMHGYYCEGQDQVAITLSLGKVLWALLQDVSLDQYRFFHQAHPTKEYHRTPLDRSMPSYQNCCIPSHNYKSIYHS